MPQPASRFLPLRPLLRQAALLAGISLLLALALILYLYGTQGQFFSRLFGAFFVFFWLLAITFLAAVPFVSWAAANWFGSAWAEAPVSSGRRKKSAVAVSRTPVRAVARPKPSNHNHP
ncbi:hypothetical protein [Hymenobacter actinosclerus]|uniref:Uncharacterized protein n=1 Tax=Hymenobacter actinosclerus TaxID=82805 RepID=A0A1H9ZUH2_9BACT|nr:hypothetical protein [Hymenobacter actinosclerus]SES85435.1 hypothetical protein SAMN04487998_0478 [Hymenobacter actinosclerus]